MGWIEASGDIASASTAMGGLLLVFIGAITTSLATYRTEDQQAVRPKFKNRARLALVGFLFALLAAVLSICAKISGFDSFAVAAAISIGLSFISVCFAAITAYRDLG